MNFDLSIDGDFTGQIQPPRPNVFKSEKALGFVIDKFPNSAWC